MEIGYDRVTSTGICAALSEKEKVLVQIGFLGQHFSLRFLFLLRCYYIVSYFACLLHTPVYMEGAA